jgi:DNA-binding PadR family transcriptional regulator
MIHENAGTEETGPEDVDRSRAHGDEAPAQGGCRGGIHHGIGHAMHHGGPGCGYVVVRGFPERGWIKFLILRVLYEEPMHGYQLLEEIEKRSGGYHKLMPGSIYTILRRMEHRGLLRSEWEKVESGPDRRIYRLTDEGVALLKTGLESIARRRKLTDDLVKFYEKEFEGKK